MLSRRKEMDEKWEDRQEQLRMCECTCDPELGEGGRLLPRWEQGGVIFTA